MTAMRGRLNLPKGGGFMIAIIVIAVLAALAFGGLGLTVSPLFFIATVLVLFVALGNLFRPKPKRH
jgi:hypothetical protein